MKNYLKINIFRQNGQEIITSIAVVVQEMVAADAAGVLFTRDPLNGNPEHLIITANFGLGEVTEKKYFYPNFQCYFNFLYFQFF